MGMAALFATTTVTVRRSCAFRSSSGVFRSTNHPAYSRQSSGGKNHHYYWRSPCPFISSPRSTKTTTSVLVVPSMPLGRRQSAPFANHRPTTVATSSAASCYTTATATTLHAASAAGGASAGAGDAGVDAVAVVGMVGTPATSFDDGQRPFQITTPIYYVNDKPHIGHAYTSTGTYCITVVLLYCIVLYMIVACFVLRSSSSRRIHA